jgi:hypothetical protein
LELELLFVDMVEARLASPLLPRQGSYEVRDQLEAQHNL